MRYDCLAESTAEADHYPARDAEHSDPTARPFALIAGGDILAPPAAPRLALETAHGRHWPVVLPEFKELGSEWNYAPSTASAGHAAGATQLAARDAVPGPALCALRSYRRTGTLWEGRYRAAAIDSEAYFLACCGYIELDPVRAGMAARPGDHPWSSRRAHALGAPDPIVAGHALHHALGGTAAARREAYRALFDAPLDEGFIDGLRCATNDGWAFGDARVKRRIAQAMRRRVAPLPKGRRPTPHNDPRQINLL